MCAKSRIFFALIGLVVSCAIGATSGWFFASSMSHSLSSVAELEQLKTVHQQVIVENNKLRSQLLAIQSLPIIPSPSTPKSSAATASSELPANTDVDNHANTVL